MAFTDRFSRLLRSVFGDEDAAVEIETLGTDVDTAEASLATAEADIDALELATNRGADGFRKQLFEIDLVAATHCDGNETDTGTDLPDSGVVTNVWLEVTTGHGSAATLDVGFLSSESSGDPDGFIDGISVETAGFFVPSLTGAVAAATRGALMREAADNDVGDTVQVPGWHSLNGNNKSISVTSSADISGGAFVGVLYIEVMTKESP